MGTEPLRLPQPGPGPSPYSNVVPIVETDKAGMGSRAGIPTPPLANSAGSRLMQAYAKVVVAESQLGASDVELKL